MCRLFEYNGFPCRHVLCVLQSLGVFNIPPHYILKQWSKDAKSLDSTSSTSNIPKGIQLKKQRFDKLFYQATKLSEEGSLSSGSFNIAYCALQDALKKCIWVNRSLKEHDVELDGAYKVDKENIDDNLLHDISLLDPQISSMKGAPKRMKKGIEKCKKRILNTKSRKVS